MFSGRRCELGLFERFEVQAVLRCQRDSRHRHCDYAASSLGICITERVRRSCRATDDNVDDDDVQSYAERQIAHRPQTQFVLQLSSFTKCQLCKHNHLDECSRMECALADVLLSSCLCVFGDDDYYYDGCSAMDECYRSCCALFEIVGNVVGAFC